MLALSRFWSAWRLLHPLTNRSSSCHRMAGACSAKVLVATADRRVISRPRECGNQQPSHVISSSLHVVHAVHANDAEQQAAGAPVVASRPASALPSIEPLLRSSALTTKRASSRARVASGDGLRSDTQSVS